MIDSRVFLSIPLDFQNKCKIYPPSINEILSEKNFPIYKDLLCISQEDIEDQMVKNNKEGKMPTPIEYLLSAAYHNKEIEQILYQGFKFFLHEQVTFLYDLKAILIGNVEEIVSKLKSIKDLKMIQENDFFDFQNLIRTSLGMDQIEKPNPDEDPRIKRMKAKARYRDRVKAKSGKGGISLQTSLEAICCMGIGITPLNVGQLSYASLNALMERYQLKEKYELDIKSLLAGAKSSKVNPVYWIKN